MIPIEVSPFIEALKDQICFQGPDPGKYAGIGYFLTDEVSAIIAQDLRMEWWVIENPDADGYCFVRKADNSESGDTSDVPMWRDPEVLGEDGTPLLACRADLNKEKCEAAGGTYREPASAAAYCDCD
jgi:hypothetical protein